MNLTLEQEILCDLAEQLDLNTTMIEITKDFMPPEKLEQMEKLLTRNREVLQRRKQTPRTDQSCQTSGEPPERAVFYCSKQ